MVRSLARALLALALVGALFTGCGTRPKPPLSKTAYVAAFKAAHRKALRSLESGGTPSPARGRTVLRTLRGKLARLRPPVEVQGAHDQYLAGLDALGGSTSPGAARKNAGPLLLSSQDEFTQQGYDFSEVLDPRLLESVR